MSIIAALLTVALIIDSLFLGLLILVQLPKKEAGVGMAFGGGTADALFGAGSGTALSNLTKYSAGAFFALVFVLSILNTRMHHSSVSDFKNALKNQPLPVQTAPASVPSPAAVPTAPVTLSNSTSLAVPTVPTITAPARTNK